MLSAAGRGVVEVTARRRCVLVQHIIHKHLHFKNPITHSLTHSLTCLSRQLVLVRGVIFESEIASPAGVIAQGTIHKHLQTSRIQSLTYSLVSTAGIGAWSNLWDSNCLPRRCHCKALDTLVLRAAGRCVVQVATRRRCVLVQHIIHKHLNRIFYNVSCEGIYIHLHFKNSLTHSLTCVWSNL